MFCSLSAMIKKPDDLTPEECEEAFAIYRIHKTKMTKVPTKRKNNSEELLTNCKKKKRTENDREGIQCNPLNEVINLEIPHVGEKIFSNLDTYELVPWLAVSEPWKVLIENVLTKRWQGKIREAYKDDQMKVVKLLLLKSAVEEDRTYVFTNACFGGHKGVVKLLLDHSDSKNIDVNAKDSLLGKTAFMNACYSGNKGIVKLLLDHPGSKDIDVNDKDIVFGMTAFMFACESFDEQVVKVLLKHSDRKDIDLNARDNVGKTAFIRACATGEKEVVKVLLDHQGRQTIDFKAQDNDGNTAIEVAFKEGRQSMAKFLQNHPKMKK